MEKALRERKFWRFRDIWVDKITRANITLATKWRPATPPKPAILSSFLSGQSCQSEQNTSEPRVVEKKVGVPFILTILTRVEDNLLALKRPNPVSEWSHDNYWRAKRCGSDHWFAVQVSL